jgi:hypothetical protein
MMLAANTIDDIKTQILRRATSSTKLWRRVDYREQFHKFLTF